MALEIKSTLSQENAAIRISNENQLDFSYPANMPCQLLTMPSPFKEIRLDNSNSSAQSPCSSCLDKIIFGLWKTRIVELLLINVSTKY